MIEGPTLETERLILRPPVEADQFAVVRHMADYDVASMMSVFPHPLPEGYGKAWWARVLERDAEGMPPYFMIEPKEAPSEGAEGCVAFTPLKGREAEGVWRLGYWIDRPWWGRGLMSEAVACVLAYADETWQPTRVVAGVFADNPASKRVLEKMGFRYMDTTDEWSEARQTKAPHLNYAKRRS